jgi:hypothetical protein
MDSMTTPPRQLSNQDAETAIHKVSVLADCIYETAPLRHRSMYAGTHPMSRVMPQVLAA